MATAKTKRPRTATSNIQHPQESGRSKTLTSMFKMNTDIGQHVLKNPGVAQAIVDKADLKQSDTVLEVGPGTGNLTVRILPKAKKVVAVELDPRMAAEVTKRVQGQPGQKRLQILLGDVVKTELPYFDVCISNTPYQISSPLVFKLLALSPAPRVCILMFQREFALRLFASPGDRLYSRLSANAQMWAHIDNVMSVGRNNFRPPPQVDSSVVRLVPKSPRPQISYEEWDGLLRICFMRKNRTLRANFLGTSSVLELLEENWKTWCAQHDITVNEDSILEAPEGEAAGEVTEHMEQMRDSSGDDEMGEYPNLLVSDLPLQDRTAKSNSRVGRSRVTQLVREKIRHVVEDVTKLADKRARNCDQGDFLSLLWEFNKEGLHFA